MKKPKYKEFDNLVEPTIKRKKVYVVTKHKCGQEITTLLNADELRELADYLDSL